MSVYSEGVFQRGFGTFPLRGNELSVAVRNAIDIGYRAFDTAQWYGNENDLGAVLAEAGVPRDDLLITTKVHPENMSAERFLPSVEQSLRDLGLFAVDVLLLHWPPGDGPVEPSLELLQEACRLGYARHIGVSNYTTRMMRRALQVLDVPLVVNQVEFHPLLNQDKLLATSAETGIPLSSYCSIARGEIFKYPVLADIGERHGKSAAQVTLRWILQKGVTMNTMSTRRENMRANFDIMDFALTDEDMRQIDGLTVANYRISNADVVPFAPTWD
ncbi:aldo/keto reductase [Alphaproteobacteria bacterium GH1-50]|uniref:Aldo/keto reductase n=1 Tax=Kangsaoukella pontilimi TaxID=2691042 RepID=A0A7C9IFM8_9RHOB|nr:aldo/keto reductase [Kangsaoukella pontilimi]MXQ07367.1 aldo/keto reductase [Kangsaoukella pontilimi]